MDGICGGSFLIRMSNATHLCTRRTSKRTIRKEIWWWTPFQQFYIHNVQNTKSNRKVSINPRGYHKLRTKIPTGALPYFIIDHLTRNEPNSFSIAGNVFNQPFESQLATIVLKWHYCFVAFSTIVLIQILSWYIIHDRGLPFTDQCACARQCQRRGHSMYFHNATTLNFRFGAVTDANLLCQFEAKIQESFQLSLPPALIRLSNAF